MTELKSTTALGVFFAVLAAGSACSDASIEPWNPAELADLSREFEHIAEAYAVVDACMPMIEQDDDAQYRLLSEIDVRQYAQLSKIDTNLELARFIAHHRRFAGSDSQAAILEQVYRDAYDSAVPHLASIEVCVETVSDYANTILHTVVEP